MDTQNDGLEKVPPFENGNFGIFLVSISGVYIYKHMIYCSIPASSRQDVFVDFLK